MLADEISAPRTTNALAIADIIFNVEPGSETYPLLEPAAVLDGREVFELAPNWRDPIDVKHIWSVETVDFDFGRTTNHRPVDFPGRLHSATYLRCSPAEVATLLDAFLRAKGRRGSFFVSTHQQDLLPTAPLAAAGATLVVAGEDVSNAYAADPVHKALAVRLRSGETLYRAIADIEIVAGDSVVSMAAPWGQNVAVADIDSVSWLLNSRFGSDELTIEWLTASVAQAKLAIQSLPNVAATDWLALRATVEGDDRETVPGDDRAVIYFPVNP
jgi:hypothetical protein